NYAFGLTPVSLRDYVLASWIGMLPGTVMYVYLGSAVKNLADLAAGNVERGVGQYVLFGVGLVATVAVTVVMTRIAQRALSAMVPGVALGQQTATERKMTQSIHIVPEDTYNCTLVANTHPPDWVNPEPTQYYNLVVIGAGTAGLVTAAGAAGLGAKVALIE